MFHKPSDEELRAQLSSMQYEVTQQCGTEPPFRNEYWNNHEPGIYVDVVSGKALFSSTDKFESGTGWPSFAKPIDTEAVESKQDDSLGMERTEVRSSKTRLAPRPRVRRRRRRPPGCATASTRPRCASSPSRHGDGRLRPVPQAVRAAGEEVVAET